MQGELCMSTPRLPGEQPHLSASGGDKTRVLLIQTRIFLTASRPCRSPGVNTKRRRRLCWPSGGRGGPAREENTPAGEATPARRPPAARDAGTHRARHCPPPRGQPPASHAGTPTSCSAAGRASSPLLCAPLASEASSSVGHAEGSGCGKTGFPLQPHRSCARDLLTKAKATGAGAAGSPCLHGLTPAWPRGVAGCSAHTASRAEQGKRFGAPGGGRDGTGTEDACGCRRSAGGADKRPRLIRGACGQPRQRQRPFRVSFVLYF